jgi:hypothetical protein
VLKTLVLSTSKLNICFFAVMQHSQKTRAAAVVTLAVAAFVGWQCVAYNRRRKRSACAKAASERNASSICVSAPGKVLITGGYLVLERPHAGVILGTTARFRSTAAWVRRAVSCFPLCLLALAPQLIMRSPYNACLQVPQHSSSRDRGSEFPLRIVVCSPQFRSRYEYVCERTHRGELPTIRNW